MNFSCIRAFKRAERGVCSKPQSRGLAARALLKGHLLLPIKLEFIPRRSPSCTCALLALLPLVLLLTTLKRHKCSYRTWIQHHSHARSKALRRQVVVEACTYDARV